MFPVAASTGLEGGSYSRMVLWSETTPALRPRVRIRSPAWHNEEDEESFVNGRMSTRTILLGRNDGGRFTVSCGVM